MRMKLLILRMFVDQVIMSSTLPLGNKTYSTLTRNGSMNAYWMLIFSHMLIDIILYVYHFLNMAYLSVCAASNDHNLCMKEMTQVYMYF